jgi:hypothetical protein
LLICPEKQNRYSRQKLYLSIEYNRLKETDKETLVSGKFFIFYLDSLCGVLLSCLSQSR